MGNTIDTKIVEMKFNNDGFEDGVKGTINSLQELAEALNLKDTVSSIAAVSAENTSVLNGVANSIDAISSKLGLFGAIGFSAIQSLTQGFMGLSGQLLTAITTPLVEGGKKRALNLEQAKFQFEGLGMDVEATMADALYAVESTAYGLDEAAVAAAMFGASGMRAGEDMRHALRGISGVAAMSGSQFGDIANVFTKVAGQGRLMGDDLNRLASRGVNAAATLGNTLGKSEFEVRDMVTKGKISFEMFASAMDDAFGEHATKANETFTGALSNVKSALARIGAAFYTNQFEAMRVIFVALIPVVNAIAAGLASVTNIIGTRMVAAAGVVSDFFANFHIKQLMWSVARVTTGVLNIFDALGAILKVIGQAFLEAFPPITLNHIGHLTRDFRDFTATLMPTPKVLESIKKAASAVFSIFKLGVRVLGFFYIVFRDIFVSLLDAVGVSNNFSEGVWNIVDALSEFILRITNSSKITDFFAYALDGIRSALDVIKGPIESIVQFVSELIDSFHGANVETSELTAAFSNFFDSVKGAIASSGIVEFFGRLKESIDIQSWLGSLKTSIVDALDALSELFGSTDDVFGNFLNGEDSAKEATKSFTAFEKFARFLQGVWETLVKVQDAVMTALTPIGEALLTVFDNLDLEKAMEGLTTLLKSGILWEVMGMFKNLRNLFGDLDEGTTKILDNIASIFEQYTGVLEDMQTKLKADALKSIAVAILLIALSMVALSLIDTRGLVNSTVAMSLILGELVVVIKQLDTMNNGKGILAAVGALDLLAIALLIMATAVAKLAKLDPGKLLYGTVAIGTLLGMIFLFAKYFKTADNFSGLTASANTLITFGIAMLIFAGAVKTLAGLDMERMALSVAALGGLLGGVVVLSKFMNADALKESSTGVAAIAGAMLVMAIAIKLLADLKPKVLMNTLKVLGAAMALLIVALELMPEGELVQQKAAAMVIVAGSLIVFSIALERIGNLKAKTIKLGLEAIGVALIFMGGALALMSSQNVLASAGGIFIVSAAMIVLAAALTLLGSIPLKTLGIGLGALAVGLIIIGAAGFLLTEASVGLFALGAAVMMIGAGIFFVVASIGLLAMGLGVLFAAVAFGGATLVTFLTSLAVILPFLAFSLAKAIGAFVRGLIEEQATFVDGVVILVEAMLSAFTTLLPKMMDFLGELIDSVSVLLGEKVPIITDALLLMLKDMMKAFRKRMPEIYELAADLIVQFLNGLNDNAEDVITAGADLVVTVLEGIGDNQEKLINAAMELILKFINGLAKGVRKYGNELDAAMGNLIDAVWDSVLTAFGVKEWYDFGVDIIQGIIDGVVSMTDPLVRAVTGTVAAADKGGKKKAKVNSPSKLFMIHGASWIEGMVKGVKDNAGDVNSAVEDVVTTAFAAMAQASAETADMFNEMGDPVIRPVVNLDNVRASVKEINSSMASVSAISAKNIGSSMTKRTIVPDSDANDVTPTGAFVQNIYSPTALSRLEIYRQTRNQLIQLKGAGA